LPPAGIHWDHPATRELATDMVDEDGCLARIGIAPQTLQDPSAIEVCIPFTMSPATIEWSAQQGVTPIIFTPIEPLARGCLDLYQGAAAAAGRMLDWGRGVGHFREIVVADTDAEACAIMGRGLGYIWTRWHDWFGFNEALRHPGEKGAIPNTPATVRERGYSICGAVDTVTRHMARMIETFNADLIVPWMAVGPAPVEALLKSNELLVEKVLPRIGVKLRQVEPRLRADVTAPTWRA
jgi:alkanesulfonate monooxygenase SsuD/methylene tetrahydromethanopterin reductase-like flavin-dependent oxidoreductase (luciferase family)